MPLRHSHSSNCWRPTGRSVRSGVDIYMIDDRGELWHSAPSRQLRAAFGSPFSGGEFVDYAVRNLGFVAVKSQGAASQVWLRPSFAATRALNSLRNWLQQAQVERLVITLFEDGWRGGRQDELVGPAQTDQRIDALVQRKLLSTAWSAAGASGDSVACVPCRMGRMRPVVDDGGSQVEWQQV